MSRPWHHVLAAVLTTLLLCPCHGQARGRPEEAEQLAEQAERERLQGHLQQAVAHLQRACQVYPLPLCFYRLGQAQEQAGALLDAQEAYARCLRDRRATAELGRRALGRLQGLLVQREEAAQLAQKADQALPLGRYQEAEQLLEKAQNRYPLPGYLCRRAQLYEKLHLPGKAESLYRACLDHPRASVEEQALASQRLNALISRIQEAQRLYSQGREAHMAGRYAQAVDRYREACLIECPPVVLLALGRAREKLGQRQEALTAYACCVSAKENSPVEKAGAQKRLLALRARPPLRAAGLALGALGVTGLITGVGLHAAAAGGLSAFQMTPDLTGDDQARRDERDRILVLSTGSAVSYALGTVSLLAGAALFGVATYKTDAGAHGALCDHLHLWPTRGGSGLSLDGRF